MNEADERASLVSPSMNAVEAVRGSTWRNAAGILGALFSVGVIVTSISKAMNTVPGDKIPVELVSSSIHTAIPFIVHDDDSIKCDDILLGAWVETCFVVSDPNGIFPGMQGLLSFPIIITRASDGGVDLHGYSIRDPFFGGRNYLELGHGTPSRVASPSPTTNCVAQFKSKMLVGEMNEWDDDDADYYWNRVAHDTVFVGNGNGAACHFRRLYGSECRGVRDAVMERFDQVRISIVLPDEQELCGE